METCSQREGGSEGETKKIKFCRLIGEVESKFHTLAVLRVLASFASHSLRQFDHPSRADYQRFDTAVSVRERERDHLILLTASSSGHASSHAPTCLPTLA